MKAARCWEQMYNIDEGNNLLELSYEDALSFLRGYLEKPGFCPPNSPMAMMQLYSINLIP